MVTTEAYINPGKKETGTGRKDGEHRRQKYANAGR